MKPCAFVFDSKLPCGTTEDHPIHHEDWNRGRPGWEPDHLFVPGPDAPGPTYTETLRRSVRAVLAAEIEKLPTCVGRACHPGTSIERAAVFALLKDPS